MLETPVTDLATLVQAIRSRPDDDTPRLAAADWFQDRGEVSRAEFIRVSCELARIHPQLDNNLIRSLAGVRVEGGDADARKALRKAFRLAKPLFGRKLKLLNAMDVRVENGSGLGNEAGWVGIGLAGVKFNPRYARGFVASVRCSWADWSEFGDRVWESHPVGWVKLTTEPVFPEWGQRRIGGPLFADVAGRVVEVDERDVVLHRGKLGVGTPLAVLARGLLLGKRWPGVAFELPPIRLTFTGEAVTTVGTAADLTVEEGHARIDAAARYAAEHALRERLHRIPPRDVSASRVGLIVDLAIRRGDFRPNERDELVEMGLRMLAAPAWR